MKRVKNEKFMQLGVMGKNYGRNGENLEA